MRRRVNGRRVRSSGVNGITSPLVIKERILSYIEAKKLIELPLP
jgi:hypothetical protein